MRGGPTGSRHDPIVVQQRHQRGVAGHHAILALADHRPLHPVVEDFLRRAAHGHGGGDVTAYHGVQIPDVSPQNLGITRGTYQPEGGKLAPSRLLTQPACNSGTWGKALKLLVASSGAQDCCRCASVKAVRMALGTIAVDIPRGALRQLVKRLAEI